ncbi:SusC/RagA family TonB-linked outer membrane protein [Pedobacter namyangjuensis]|uniref:SusC/RagA family TonB-linked outer membrane protein n=1 Tax=Pedobacter namyangjuensis TaxID=600626 RepID=UPI000DE3F60D|nr:TonB-dependent receptor [Pedobacter namyangjuensis]
MKLLKPKPKDINRMRRKSDHAKNQIAFAILSFFCFSFFNVSFTKAADSYTYHVNSVIKRDITIKGTVKDELGSPIPGVSIKEKGTSNTAITNDQGEFTIKATSEQSILVISYLGFSTQEIKATNNINIVLKEDAAGLDEVVVVGFGQQKKASVVGAISTISAKDLKVPTSTLSNAFAGRVAGIIAVQRGGEPGADGSNFYIRGISTFAGPASALIFIDGIESTTADMNALPSEVIDNFSVLKDASATALYGARGANGVLLITTKRGGDLNKAIINARIENTFSTPTQLVKMANGVDYMNAFNYAILNRNPTASPRFSQEKINGTMNGLDPILYPNVDWQDYLFKEYSANQYANLNVKGGSQKADYFVSANFNNNNGMLKKDPLNKFNSNIREKQYNLLANVGVNLTSQTKIVLRLNSRLEDYGGTNTSIQNIYNQIFYAPPALFAPVLPNQNNEDYILFGNLNGGPIPSGSGSNIYRNPYATMVSGYNKRFSSTNTASIDASQDLKFLLPGLTLKGLLSFRNYARTNVLRNFTPYYNEVSGSTTDAQGNTNYIYKSVSRGNSALTSTTNNEGNRLMNVNFVLDWLKSYGNHDVSAMVTYLSREQSNNTPGTDANAFRNSLPVRNQGFAGRLTYGYKSKYFFEGNFGYNGSENFAKGDRFGFFPSLAAGYLISNEEFWQPLSKVVSSLKIRGSWGIVGNAAVYSSDGSAIKFPYLDNVSLTGLAYTFGDTWQTTASGAQITTLGATGAIWERGEKMNLGIDLSLFNKLTVSADVYKENRDDIFMQREVIPAETGIITINPYANLGKVKNEGFDVNLSYNQQVTKNFFINLRGTITYAKNTLIARDEPQLAYPYLSKIGHPLNHQFGLIADGLYKDAADVTNSAKSAYSNVILPGDIKYRDLNNDGIINDNDRTVIGTPYVPQLIYGFGLTSKYKNFDFGFFFQGSGKSSIMMSSIHPFNSDQSTLFDFIAKDYWREDNPNAAYPRLINNINSHNNFQPSTFWLRDVSFLRLKNVEVGYTYKNYRLFFSGQNLLTFSDFKHWDPEVGSANGLTYPNLKVYSIALQLNF